MNNDNHNNSNSNSNWYGELANKDEDDIGSLHTISDDSISITTVQAIAKEAEVQQLKLEIAQELQLLNTDIKQANKRVTKALSTLIDKDKEELESEDDDDMTVLPTLKIEEEF